MMEFNGHVYGISFAFQIPYSSHRLSLAYFAVSTHKDVLHKLLSSLGIRPSPSPQLPADAVCQWLPPDNTPQQSGSQYRTLQVSCISQMRLLKMAHSRFDLKTNP